jgi:hypothetical protein
MPTPSLRVQGARALATVFQSPWLPHRSLCAVGSEPPLIRAPSLRCTSLCSSDSVCARRATTIMLTLQYVAVELIRCSGTRTRRPQSFIVSMAIHQHLFAVDLIFFIIFFRHKLNVTLKFCYSYIGTGHNIVREILQVMKTLHIRECGQIFPRIVDSSGSRPL